MRIQTYNILRNLEEKINEGMPIMIFQGYRAINKRGIEKLIDELYSTLPTDVKQAREYLNEKNIDIKQYNSDILYENIKNFETNLEKGLHIAKYVIVNIQQLENLIDRIYASIPTEIVTAKNIEKLDDM